jgi:acyl carrier protein
VSFDAEAPMGLDLVELTMSFEEEFGLNIPDEAANRHETVGQTIDWIVTELRRRGPVDKAAVAKRVREIVSGQLVVLLDEVRAESRYVEDLHAD